MKDFLRFIYRIFISLKSLLHVKDRFIRLTPFSTGTLFFYDKKSKNFFKIKARDNIDSITADQIFTYGDYELKFLKRYEELMSIYRNIEAQGLKPLIIDCGANVGFSSLYFARTYPSSKILAIEPESSNFEFLNGNCKKFKNIKPLKAAVSCKNEPVVIVDRASKNNAFQVVRPLNEIKQDLSIPSITINEIIKKYSIDAFPFIIKIDIEGFESDLFESNLDWIETTPIIIIELHDWMLPKSSNSRNFLNAIANRNRDFVFKGENVFSIKN